MGNKHRDPTILLATLGTEPQVVTLAVWALEHKLIPPVRPQEVWVVHTSRKDPQIRESLATLETAFNEEPLLEDLRLRLFPITSRSDKHFSDLETLQAVKATFRTLYQTLRLAKGQGFAVHFSVAGGRKPMSIFGIVAAQLLFDEQDRAWHLISSKSLTRSRRLFPVEPGDRVHLVPIPVIPWSDVEPLATLIAQEDDPFEAAEIVGTFKQRRRRYVLQLFVEGRLTPAERQVLRRVVLKGGTLTHIARELGKSPRTVEHQLQSIYQKIRNHRQDLGLDIPEDTKLTRDFLVRVFGEVFR